MQVSPEVTPDSIPAVRKITVLGAGAWGTAVAMALAGRHDVLLWGRNSEAMAAMAASGETQDWQYRQNQCSELLFHQPVTLSGTGLVFSIRV